MTTFRRTPAGGRINRLKPLGFTYNGKSLTGFEGDTIASALLANDEVIIGRSFKYHRPRGFLSSGVEEANGLFTLGEGSETVPNVIGTTTQLKGGMKIRSQNAWPSPAFDLMAVNSLAAPLFTAGFYYKTFMGPFKRSWMFYEPFIRKAAGLGAATEDRGTTFSSSALAPRGLPQRRRPHARARGLFWLNKTAKWVAACCHQSSTRSNNGVNQQWPDSQMSVY
jgi:hypothetical protein